MKPWVLAFACLLLVSGQAAGWGVKTQEYFCRTAVARAWGEEVAIKCLDGYNTTNQLELCSLLEDKTRESACLARTDLVHPAVFPYVVLNDTGVYGRDYADCPIKLIQDRKYLCGNKADRPAISRAQEWFTMAGKSASECGRVWLFCVGGNYLAGASFPPNKVNATSTNDCESLLTLGVEKKIDRSEKYWSVKEFCDYEYRRPLVGQMRTSKYSQDYTMSEKTAETVVAGLVSKALEVKSKPLQTTVSTVETTVAPSTTTTMEAVETTTQPETTIRETETIVGGETTKKSSNPLKWVLALIVVAAASASFRKRRRKETKPRLHQ